MASINDNHSFDSLLLLLIEVTEGHLIINKCHVIILIILYDYNYI